MIHRINSNGAVIVLDDGVLAGLEDMVAQQKGCIEELKGLKLTLPDLTFDRSLIMHRGDRVATLDAVDAGMGGRFDESIAGNIEKVYRDLEANKY